MASFVKVGRGVAALALLTASLGACTANRDGGRVPAAPPGATPEVKTEMKTLGHFLGEYDGETMAFTPIDADGNPIGPKSFGPREGDPVQQPLLPVLTATTEGSTFGTGVPGANTILVKQTALRSLDGSCNGLATTAGDNIPVFQGVCAPIETRNGYAASEVIRTHVEITSLTSTVGVTTILVNAGTDTGFLTNGTIGVWNHGRMAKTGTVDGSAARVDYAPRIWYFASTVAGAMARFSYKFVVKGEVATPIRRSTGTVCIPNNASRPQVSSDGRYIVYATSLPNMACRGGQALVGSTQIWRYDTQTNTETLVSYAEGAPASGANGAHSSPSISSDGSMVAWLSTSDPGVALPLTTGDAYGFTDTNGALADVFVRNMGDGSLFIASADGNGTTVAAASARPQISADGSVVAFDTVGVLDPADMNDDGDVYVRDVFNGTVELKTSGAAGRTIAATNGFPSTGGASVGYLTADPLIVGGGVVEAVVNASGTHRRVSAVGGVTPNAAVNSVNLSSDGTVVAFDTAATNVLAGAGGAFTHIYVRRADLTGSIVRADFVIDASETVTEAGASASRPWLSSDGRLVTFVSSAGNMDPLDTNGLTDAYMYDVNPTLFAGGTQDIKRRRPFVISTSEGNAIAGGGVTVTGNLGAVATGNGRYAVFVSSSASLTGSATLSSYIAPLR